MRRTFVSAMLQVASTTNANRSTPTTISTKQPQRSLLSGCNFAPLLVIMYYLWRLLLLSSQILKCAALHSYSTTFGHFSISPLRKHIQAKSYTCACSVLLYCRKHALRFLIAAGLSLLTTLLLLCIAFMFDFILLLFVVRILLWYSLGYVPCNARWCFNARTSAFSLFFLTVYFFVPSPAAQCCTASNRRISLRSLRFWSLRFISSICHLWCLSMLFRHFSYASGSPPLCFYYFCNFVCWLPTLDLNLG